MHPRFGEGRVHGVRETCQVYIEADWGAHTRFPLLDGDDVRGMLVDDSAILLWPATDPPELPIEVRPDPHAWPWPLETSLGTDAVEDLLVSESTDD